VPDDTTEEDLQRTGQPLETEALLAAIDLHLNDGVTVHRGRAELRNPGETDAQFGAPAELNDMVPDRSIDGLDEYVADQEESADETEPGAEADG